MCLSPYLVVGGRGGGGLPRGLGHNLLMQLSSLGSSKMEISETGFPDIFTIQNDQIILCKACFSRSLCVFPLFGCSGGGGVPRGLGHNLLMQLSSLGSSKMEISETDFSDILTIQNDQIILCKACFSPSLCVFHPIGVLGGGAAPKGAGAQFAYAVFQPRSSLSPLRGALPKAIEFSLVPSAQVGLGQKISLAPSVPLTTQGLRGGGGGVPPTAPKENAARPHPPFSFRTRCGRRTPKSKFKFTLETPSGSPT